MPRSLVDFTWRWHAELPGIRSLITFARPVGVSEDQVHDVREGRLAPRTVNGSALMPPLDDWGWLEAAIVSGDVLVPGSDVRSQVFHQVEVDGDGLITRHLLAFTTDRRLSVRRTIFELLYCLCFQKPGWLLVADAAETALKDVDPQVRRRAAALLVNTADHHQRLRLAGHDQLRSLCRGCGGPGRGLRVRVGLPKPLLQALG
ncbi:hypothetical protein [Krasilnikovia sp. MM14-A1259]|uniref:hypothetical protein n=1 Tax=Krasilnikovia sp. MM14-A1259 TaxID=3373539 RepID=UPI00399C5E11